MTRPLVTFPDPVALLLPWLRALSAAGQAPTATYAGRVPNPRPDGPLVTLRRAGGTESGVALDRPRVDVQVWHRDDYAASQLAGNLRALMLGSPGRLAGVTRASTFLGPTPVPDPESGQARYLFSVELHVHGTST